MFWKDKKAKTTVGNEKEQILNFGKICKISEW